MKTVMAISGLLLMASFSFKNMDNIIVKKENLRSRLNTNDIIEKRKIFSNDTTETNSPEDIDINLENQLVAHSRFVFLEYLELDLKELENFNECTLDYLNSPGYVRCFQLESKVLNEKYESIIGKNVIVNNHDRYQIEVPISELVVVMDGVSEYPYLAATVDLNVDDDIYYAWASTNYNNEFYPFENIENESLQIEIEEEVKSLQSYKNYNQFDYSDFPYDDIYDESSLEMYSSPNGDVFTIIQFNRIGACNSIVDNLTLFLKKSKEKLEVLAEGVLTNFSIDLIDVNNDGFPEVLMGDFASSIIYEIKNGKFEIVQEFYWSTTECPC